MTFLPAITPSKESRRVGRYRLLGPLNRHFSAAHDWATGKRVVIPRHVAKGVLGRLNQNDAHDIYYARERKLTREQMRDGIED